MTQQIIDVGNVANDGTGDSLRTAFIKSNDNFTELYSGGSPGIVNGTSNISIATANGNVSTSVDGTSNVMVVSSTLVSITGDLTVSGNASLSGNILGDRIVNGTTELNIQVANGNANLTVGGTSNVVVWDTTGQFVTGLISASGNITGGNLRTAGLITATGNITGGNVLTGLISASGNITGGNVLYGSGRVSGTGNVNGANIVATALVQGVTLSATGAVTFSGTTTSQSFGTSQSSGTLTLGGTAQTGAINMGRSTVSQTIAIGNGITASGSTKTIDIGTLGAANSITNISIGTNAGNGNVTFSANTLVAIANTSNTALSVAGNVTGGNILTAGVIKTTAKTFATLPAAANVGAGARSFITDANTATWGSQVNSGGANAVPVWTDGTNWYVG
jgi:hypothetical protein